MITATPNTPLTKEQYEDLLHDLILATVERHGKMSVQCLRERVNQEIVTNGIIGAAQRVRESR